MPWSADMQHRTELTLDEMLAEPIVLTLMKSDGISVDEARSFFARVGSRPNRRRKKKIVTGASDRVAFGPHLQPPGAHLPCCM
jgi:hypothetical protein